MNSSINYEIYNSDSMGLCIFSVADKLVRLIGTGMKEALSLFAFQQSTKCPDILQYQK
jgi:hypothetical protein